MWRALLALAAFAASGAPPSPSPAPAPAPPREPEAASASVAELEAAGVPAWRELWQASLDALHREPVLDSTEETVVAQLGAVAHLRCPVRDLGERRVSWVRRRDWHIISCGALVYTSDERFQVLHAGGSGDWTLQIRYVQRRDNGTYECQVASGTGALARRVHLRVEVPEALILGAAELHVDAGSTIQLVCIIENSPEPPAYVFWYHEQRMVNYEGARGVRVATAGGARAHSALTVRAATPAHAGNYSCRAPHAAPAHVYVYVAEGSDKTAATLSRDAGAAHAACRALVLCALSAHVRA